MTDSQLTAGTRDERLSDDEPAYISSSNATTPPRADEIDRWRCHIDLQQFGHDLQAAANDAFPNTPTSRYKHVYVLILSWEDEDPNLPVSLEILKLVKVFKNLYHFETEVWYIPDQDCHAEVCQKILDFAKLGGNNKRDLKIVYYAGHGKLARNRLLSWTSWRNRDSQKLKCPTVKWSGIQNILEEAQSDVLILLDCCNAGTANTNEGEGVTELISACAWNSEANGVGPYSFTNALVIELQDLGKKSSFSTGELYSNIFGRIQGRMPENGLERHPAPVHLVLTNDSQYRRSIQLSKQPGPKPGGDGTADDPDISSKSEADSADLDEENLSQTRGSTMSSLASALDHRNQSSIEENASQDFHTVAKVPRLAFAIRLRDNFRVGELSTDLFLEWLRQIPTIAEQVKVEAGFNSFSSLLIVSMPVSMSGYLPVDPAIISLGPISSSNLIAFLDNSHISASNTSPWNQKEPLRPILSDEDVVIKAKSSQVSEDSHQLESSKSHLKRAKAMMLNPPSIRHKISLSESHTSVEITRPISGIRPQMVDVRGSPSASMSLTKFSNSSRLFSDLPPQIHSPQSPNISLRHEIRLYEDRTVNATWRWFVNSATDVRQYSCRLGDQVNKDRSAPSYSTRSRLSPTGGVTENALRTIISSIPGQGDDYHEDYPPLLSTNRLDNGFRQLLDLAIACWEYDCSIHKRFRDFAEAVWKKHNPAEFSQSTFKLEAEDPINWMFIALVFEWEDIFRIMSVQVIIKYNPKGALRQENRSLPADFQELVYETRRRKTLRTYHYIRDSWISLTDPNNLKSLIMRRMHSYFSDPRLGIDLRNPMPEDLYKEIDPDNLLLEFEKIVGRNEDQSADQPPSDINTVSKSPAPIGSKGGGFSAFTRMRMHSRLKTSIKIIRNEPARSPSSSQTWDNYEAWRRETLGNLEIWRIRNQVGIPLANSEYFELRNRHIQQPASDVSSNAR